MKQAAAYLYDALNAAANGYLVLPANARTGEPLVETDKATTDPEVIRAWWTEHPDAQPACMAPKPKKLKATPYAWQDPAQIPQRQFLYGRHLARKFTAAKFAAGGVGKSILALTEAIALATGRALLGITPAQRCKVWYWNGEDPKEETERRIAAICLHYSIAKEELEGWLFIDSGREQEIVIAQTTKNGAVIVGPVVRGMVDTIADNEIDVVIIDPFVSSHRIVESDNPAMDLVAKRWNAIADETNSAVELVHHIRKTGGAEATVEDGRGASSLLNAVRSAQVLNKMTPEEGTKAGVGNHREYFKAENGKANNSPPAEGKDWYRIIPISLGNGSALAPQGDSVGVVVKWKWPDPLDGVSGADFEAAAQSIRAGRWRENPQAKDWVGWPIAKVLGLDLHGNKADKAKVTGLIKIWIGAGNLIVVDELDEKRMTRKYVQVANDD
ncbi:AAA family ATPase [Bradyrhizobium sp. CCBAU 53421]|uniref:AAA family ATPase n=1 Tax=Bradyrhizobium sp. CCBAU 53421 TaxID=1325120 RepID=UPI00188C08D8|nr:AAA family ATPase [Bradyrhizobium sp. CCBAU 53421]QOZ34429.1 recombinase RecA [Bradyrhizobium sp. CCBAU 53421]